MAVRSQNAGEVFVIHLVLPIVATTMAIVETVLAVRNDIAVFLVFLGDLEGV